MKWGRFDQEDLGQYESMAPSVMMGADDQDEEEGTFAMPTGCVPRAKQRMLLGAPSIASGSAAGGATVGQDSDNDASQQVSDSRSGIEDEQERMER